MIRFLGNIEAKADTKGRVFIPAIFRKQLQAASEERLIMRKDVFQDCLTPVSYTHLTLPTTPYV